MDVDFVRGIHCEKISHKMEAKKSKKPLMEKMRRARINDSLNELKCLVLDAMKKDASRYSKMEKADILEMTVKYLKSVQEKPQQTGAESLTKYRAGFNECAAEVTRYLMTTEHMNPRVRTELLSHLANSLTRSSPRSQQHPVLEATDKLTTATVTPQTSPNSQTPFSHARAMFPAGMHSQLVTAGTFPASLPSPPSSPLGLEKVSSVPAQQIILGGGIPAFIVPNDAFQLLPLTLQQSSPKVLEPWRPW